MELNAVLVRLNQMGIEQWFFSTCILGSPPPFFPIFQVILLYCWGLRATGIEKSPWTKWQKCKAQSHSMLGWMDPHIFPVRPLIFWVGCNCCLHSPTVGPRGRCPVGRCPPPTCVSMVCRTQLPGVSVAWGVRCFPTYPWNCDLKFRPSGFAQQCTVHSKGYCV